MTSQKYIRKLTLDPMPQHPRHARITLRYSAQKAEKLQGLDHHEGLEDSFDNLVHLAQRGFLGTHGLAVSVGTPAFNLLEVRLAAKTLPHDLIVIALRVLIGSNDNSPEDFQRLLYALDNDREAALQVYGGTNFETEVSGVHVSIEGDGPARPFDPFHLEGKPKPILQARRLKIPGWATYMPDQDTEDAILTLSGLRAFLPLGVTADYEPGEEEYSPSGDDLALARISIEAASLRAILACLGPAPVPTPVEE